MPRCIWFPPPPLACLAASTCTAAQQRTDTIATLIVCLFNICISPSGLLFARFTAHRRENLCKVPSQSLGASIGHAVVSAVLSGPPPCAQHACPMRCEKRRLELLSISRPELI